MYIDGFQPELKKHMQHLRPVDRDIVECYFGLNGKEARSIGEIADTLQDPRLPADKIKERLYAALNTLLAHHARER